MEPKIERIDVVEIRPGDTLIGRYPKTASRQDIENLVDTLRRLSKNGAFGVLPEGVSLQVLRPIEPEPEEQDT